MFIVLRTLSFLHLNCHPVPPQPLTTARNCVPTDRREPWMKMHDNMVSGIQSLMDKERRAADVIQKPRVDFHCVCVAGSIYRGSAALLVASVFWLVGW
ncbi:hypothetical protein JTB14_034886 [Gonioctena quinquepunctata]|nr:hypothetical protein JTB14_034886 [Gonioctena quinquepunctata]